MKQTAVEWLYETIDNELIDFLESRIDVNELSVAMLKAKEQAKEMEKEQIIDAFVECWKANMPDGYECKLSAEQYYEQTYGGGNK